MNGVHLTDRQRAMLVEMGVPAMSLPRARMEAQTATPAAGTAPATAPSTVPIAPRTSGLAVVESPHILNSKSAFEAVKPAQAAAFLIANSDPNSPPQVGRPPTHSAAPAGASAGWRELEANVAQCRACARCEGRKQAIFGAGQVQRPHWLIIGEGPSAEDDRSGGPFSGPGGALLTRILAALGATRHGGDTAAPADLGPAPGSAIHAGGALPSVYLTQAVKCASADGRNPSPEELARCNPHLQRQIELLQPQLLIAVGLHAVQALLHTPEPLGRLRARVHRVPAPWATGGSLPLVATYTPEFLLRSPLKKAEAWDDWCLALTAWRQAREG